MFTYKQCGSARLTAKEEQWLNEIDQFEVPFFAETEYTKLADIHAKIDVEIWDCPTSEDCLRNQQTITKGTLKRRKENYEKELKAIGERIEKLRHDDEVTPEDRENLFEKLRKQWEEIRKRLNAVGKRLDDLEKKFPEATDDETIAEEYVLEPTGLYIASRPRPKVKLFLQQMSQRPEEVVYTYIHEMMHALYDADYSIPKPQQPKIEEPMAEFGMLYLLDRFAAIHPEGEGLLRAAKESVRAKQKDVGFCYYGFGYYLYETGFMNNYNGIITYRNGAGNIGSSEERKKYERRFELEYPDLMELYVATLLKKILTDADTSQKQKTKRGGQK